MPTRLDLDLANNHRQCRGRNLAFSRLSSRGLVGVSWRGAIVGLDWMADRLPRMRESGIAMAELAGEPHPALLSACRGYLLSRQPTFPRLESVSMTCYLAGIGCRLTDSLSRPPGEKPAGVARDTMSLASITARLSDVLCSTSPSRGRRERCAGTSCVTAAVPTEPVTASCVVGDCTAGQIGHPSPITTLGTAWLPHMFWHSRLRPRHGTVARLPAVASHNAGADVMRLRYADTWLARIATAAFTSRKKKKKSIGPYVSVHLLTGCGRKATS